MFNSHPWKLGAALAVVGLCFASISAAVGQEREKVRPGVGRPEAGRPGAGVPEAGRPEAGPEEREPGDAAAGPGQTVHHHYYYGGAAPAGVGQAYSGPSYYGGGADLSGVINPSLALSQSAHQSIENHNYAISSYYANKSVHDKWQAQQYAKGRVTESEAEYFARELEPGRLSNFQFDRATKVVNWPPLLRDKQFSAVRMKLDQLFHNRTPDNSGADSDNYNDIKQNCDAMHEILKGMIKQIAMPEYVAAAHFIKSLSYEGLFAAQ